MKSQAYIEIIRKLENELFILETNSHCFIETTEKAIGLCNKVILRLRKSILKTVFVDIADEIYFFKYIKPRVFSKLIFYTELFNIESKKPDTDEEVQIRYLRNELQKHCRILKEDIAFYQYYKRNKSFSDQLYFLRGNTEHRIHFDHIPNHIDPEFSTGYDNTLGMIMASEQLIKRMGSEIQKLKRKQNGNSEENNEFISNLYWTNYNVDAVELVYALYFANVINNGKASKIDIARAFEKMFNLKFKNIYGTFKEIQGRADQTSFLRHLIETLQKYLDDLDE